MAAAGVRTFRLLGEKGEEGVFSRPLKALFRRESSEASFARTAIERGWNDGCSGVRMRMKRHTHTLSESESPIKLQVRAKVVGTLKMSQQTGTLTPRTQLWVLATRVSINCRSPTATSVGSLRAFG